MNNEIFPKKEFYLHAQKSCALQNRETTLNTLGDKLPHSQIPSGDEINRLHVSAEIIPLLICPV